MVEVLPIETPTLGDRSYLAHDGKVALVVDPQRDIDRITALAAERGVRITHVAETHMHNDYVTGGLALSRAAGASYLVNADDPVGFACRPVRDGDTVAIGPACSYRSWLRPGTPSTTWPTYSRRPPGRPGSSPADRCSSARPGGRTC